MHGVEASTLSTVLRSGSGWGSNGWWWGAQHHLKQLLGIEDSRLPRSGQDWLKTQDDGDKMGQERNAPEDLKHTMSQMGVLQNDQPP